MLTLTRAKEINQTMVTEDHLIIHSLNVCYAMGAMAEYFGADPEYWMAIGYLHDYDYEKYPEEHLAHTEEPLRERMMVFAGFPGDEFDSLLASLKAGKVGVGALKAVLTPTNAGWTSRELYRELVREREAFFRMREDRKPWR